ncbi:pyridoxamine 5'-phosphate oxidase family protein [Streptomyces sp. UNOC14_S4]|uniref:pyridoxamine 5'-phosphate oxidase family protein n=1 Tax=Streptomyces sp. UNOC14_S4 TaxID=2872340 RepID=UPI001E2882A6|nr:pyridoxamine 5'-phosphate oxidase family protein [Streptomyces sp. UNOC14_S4]MCC3766176.1 pyridoxamine 5'-phosphate oxidase family protein [Streptomyces sp. UNOC14_S4]
MARNRIEHGSRPGSPTMAELSRQEALRLLQGARIGRLVFSHQALPAVRPVNHVLLDDQIIIRTHTGAAMLGPARDGAVVAYEADEFDTETCTGWSVVVTGEAHLVRDPAAQQRYQAALEPWIGDAMDHVISISLDMVTGCRIV